MTGAKSGQPRSTPPEYFTIAGRIVLVGSYGGAPKDPAWVHNLRAVSIRPAAVGFSVCTSAAKRLGRHAPIRRRWWDGDGRRRAKPPKPALDGDHPHSRAAPILPGGPLAQAIHGLPVFA
jgi:deazaflavin-dependent oxidoreductase (nitroreductase family)